MVVAHAQARDDLEVDRPGDSLGIQRCQAHDDGVGVADAGGQAVRRQPLFQAYVQVIA